MDSISTHLRIPKADLELVELIGSGTFGAVHKGIWKGRGGGTVVAIKQIHLKGQSIRDVCKELNIMASLRFQNICLVHGGCIVDENEVWIVLDYVDGGNLHTFLKSSSSIAWNTQLSFALQAAKAINYLHNGPTPLLHRDIKSYNFLVKDGDKLLLTDFGLSKTIEAVTANTCTIGTLSWAAPEVLEENPIWCEKADIYSLGMVFYEILTQEQPFKDEANFFTIHKKIKTGIRPKLPLDCPPKFAQIIRKCWDSDPTKRPTAAEVVQYLTELSDTNSTGTALTRSCSVPKSLAEEPLTPRVNTHYDEAATGNTLLHQAAKKGLTTEVRELVEHGGCLVDATNIFGYTPLHLAAEFGHVETILELAKLGAKGNITKLLMYTPLHIAAERGHAVAVKELVRMGAQVNAKRIAGYTALHLAASAGKTEAVRELIKLGAEIDAVNASGKTSLQMAYANGHTDTARELILLGAKSPLQQSFKCKKRTQSCILQ